MKFSLIIFSQIRKFPQKNEKEEIFSQFSQIETIFFSSHSFGISMMIFYFIVQLPGFSHDFLLRPFPRHVIKFRVKKNRFTPTSGVFSKPQKCAVKLKTQDKSIASNVQNGCQERTKKTKYMISRYSCYV